jgi:hypothetical protein
VLLSKIWVKQKEMKQTLEEAAHSFAESRSSGSAFPAYYAGFIAGAEWAMKLKHDKVKLMCIKDSNKRCNQCHECDVYVLNPSY